VINSHSNETKGGSALFLPQPINETRDDPAFDDDRVWRLSGNVGEETKRAGVYLQRAMDVLQYVTQCRKAV
jgi:hypothetical protein